MGHRWERKGERQQRRNEKNGRIEVREMRCCNEADCWFPAAQTQNNHTETVLFKSLVGPLALASYWLTLTH